MFRAATSLLLLCAAALTGCSRLSPEPHSGELKILVLSYDSTAGRYRLVVGRIETLVNLRTMEGDAAKIVGGAKITIDYDELARENPQTAEDIERITMKDPGAPVDFAYFEVDGIVHPEDFHSLNIATTYYNFEKSHLYFADLGAGLYNLPVLYFPEMKQGPVPGQGLLELHDNAFWDPVARVFAVLPFKDIRELPMGMNLGIIAHEYTHAVFTNRVFPQDGIPWLFANAMNEPEKWSHAMNINRSLNEGLADFFGAAVSGDPAFIRKSLSVISDDRRLDPDSPRCYTNDLREALETYPYASYDPYPVGAVLAAALWESVSDLPDRQAAFARGLVDAMTEIGSRFRDQQERMTLPDALDAFASTFPADVKPEACGLLLDRFRLQPQRLPSCAESRPPERRCR